jgi:hypothetical protein
MQMLYLPIFILIQLNGGQAREDTPTLRIEPTNEQEHHLLLGYVMDGGMD